MFPPLFHCVEYFGRLCEIISCRRRETGKFKQGEKQCLLKILKLQVRVSIT